MCHCCMKLNIIIGLQMGDDESMCQDYDGNQKYRWCTYQATDNHSIIIQMSYLGILIVFAVIIIRYFVILFKFKKQSPIKYMLKNLFGQVFILLTLWLVFSVTKVSINLYVYVKYMSKDYESILLDSQYEITNVVLAALFNVCDFLCIFFLLLLMLLIPFQWIKTTLLSINQRNIRSDDIRVKIHRCFKVLQFVRIYYKIVRNLFIPFLLSQPFLLFFTKKGCYMPKIKQLQIYISYILVVTESVLIFSFYIFGIFVSNFIKSNRLVVILNQDYSRIKKQYIMLVAILLTRIALSFIFRLSQFYDYVPTPTCSDGDRSNKIQTTVFLIFAHYIMHSLAACTIIYIYRPNLRFLQLSQSPFESEQIDVAQCSISERMSLGFDRLRHKLNDSQQYQSKFNKIFGQSFEPNDSIAIKQNKYVKSNITTTYSKLSEENSTERDKKY